MQWFRKLASRAQEKLANRAELVERAPQGAPPPVRMHAAASVTDPSEESIGAEVRVVETPSVGADASGAFETTKTVAAPSAAPNLVTETREPTVLTFTGDVAVDEAVLILRGTSVGDLVAVTGSARLRNRVGSTTMFDVPVIDFRTDALTARAFLALPAFGRTTWDELVMRVNAYRRRVLAGDDPLSILRPRTSATETVYDRSAAISDVTLADLILAADASTRLKNSIYRSSLFQEHTVRDLLSGKLSEAEVLRVPELGRTSLRELLRLAEDHVSGCLPGGIEALEVPEEVLPPTPLSLKGRRVMDLGDHVDLPVRIGNRLRCEPSLAEMPLADIWLDPEEAFRRLRQLDGLGRQSISDLISLVQRIGSESFQDESTDAGRDAAAEGGAENSPTAAPASCVELPREQMQSAVEVLSEKHRFVLDGRYGLADAAPRTLEEMGRIAHVTRERIRQVEKKALGILGKRPWREAFEACLASESAGIWETLANGDAVVPFADTGPRAGRLDPWQLLAIDVVYGGIRGWLGAKAVESQAGWLAPGASADDVYEAVRMLEALLSTTPLPRPFAEVCEEARLTPETAEAALNLLDHARVFEGYLHQGHLGPKARRIARLHKTALQASDGGIIDVWRLAELDEAAEHDDERSPRMVLTQMGENPHLFHHLVDHWWLVLPRSGHAMGIEGRLPETVETALPRRADPGSLQAWLYDTLKSAGPLRHVDLRDQIRENFPDISAASVGPTLLGNPLFVRAAPGAWEVRGARRSTPGRALLSNRHARTYARAVRSGQGRGVYPAWTAEFEHAICVWARNEGESDIFRSLLEVADPATWPVADEVRLEWRRLRQLHGRWSLPAERHRALGEDPPTADEVLSGLALTARLGGLGWVMAGRLAHAASGAQSSADLLALLAAAGAVDAPTDWQLHHPALNPTADLLAEFAVAKYATGRLDWTEGVMTRLLEQARSGAIKVRWAAPDEVRHLVDVLAAGRPSTTKSRPVTQALAGAEDLFGSNEWDQLFSERD